VRAWCKPFAPAPAPNPPRLPAAPVENGGPRPSVRDRPCVALRGSAGAGAGAGVGAADGVGSASSFELDLWAWIEVGKPRLLISNSGSGVGAFSGVVEAGSTTATSWVWVSDWAGGGVAEEVSGGAGGSDVELGRCTTAGGLSLEGSVSKEDASSGG
jgi:hypothetical protein